VTAFPANIVTALKEQLEVDFGSEVDTVVARPLRPIDPDRSIGILAVDWRPVDHQIGQHDPALGRYQLAIQCFIKHQDEEVGLAEHTLMSKNLRTMLYRGEALRLRLASLSETSLGVTERVQRWGVRQQRFVSNEIQGRFLFLSTTEFWVETEAI
jgi:hypothetical protein